MKKRTVAILMACTLILGATVGVTFAWLISGPEAVVNTFVAGKVAITLDEAIVNESGTAESSAQRVQANEYTLIPGHSYDKDPTVHIEAGSEPCYVFVKVQNGISPIESSTNSIEEIQMPANGWEVLPAGAGINGTVYYFKTAKGKNTRVTVDTNGIITVPGTGDAVDLVVFEHFTISGDANNELIGTCKDNKITVTAYAIQALGSETAEEAWQNGGFD